MFTCVFIDFENIEKTIKQEFGSVLDYEAFVKVIKSISTANSSRLVGVYAYGDFDKGNAGLMSSLVNLGIEPRHVVTKTAHEYLKGSTDIELSLDILETSYRYPHITDYVFISGDGDLRYVIKRLQMQGKNLRLVGFSGNTNQMIIDMVNEFIPLDSFTGILRKVCKTEKEQRATLLLSNEYVQKVVVNIERLEKLNDKDFIGLNLVRKKLTEKYQNNATEISDALTNCIDFDILMIYKVDNPKDPNNPTSACKLNRDSNVVKYILKEKIQLKG